VDDSYALGRACAICGQPALVVIHLERLPDYVKCSKCDSAHILAEGSDRVMFGSIPETYPQTREFALKRWVELNQVEWRAAAERPVEETTPPFGFGSRQGPDNGDAERAPTPPFGLGTLHEYLGDQPGIAPAIEAAPAPSLEHGSAEPEPGSRFRVTVGSQEVNLPADLCAHCLRQPAEPALVVIGPEPNPVPYQLPLCADCRRRARARSEEERNYRLAVHLGSVLIGMILMVAALALGILDFISSPLLATIVLGVLGLSGYALPAWSLLGRASRIPPSADAAYVRSTLQVSAAANGRPSGFLWRNRGYAERFAAANGVAGVERVKEPADARPIPPGGQ
jgi:hypothetical protein